MSDSSATYELNARVTAWDAATSVFSKIGNHWDALINKFEMAPDDSAWVASLQKRAKYAVTFSAISAAAFVGLTTSMVHSRLAVEELTGDIRTLGATSAEIQRIESATTAMSAKLGIAQTTLLTGIYDIKSAVSTLDLSAPTISFSSHLLSLLLNRIRLSSSFIMESASLFNSLSCSSLSSPSNTEF